MPHTYSSSYGQIVGNDFRSFFEDFYRTSDDPDALEDWVGFFTHDAAVIIGTKKVVGRAGELSLLLGICVG